MKIVFCLTGSSFEAGFLDSWTKLLIHCYQRGITPIYSRKYSSVVYYARNMCLGGDVLRGIKQLPFDGKFDYDYTMWIDRDQVFEPKDFDRLLSHNVDVVGGLYKSNQHLYNAVEHWDLNYFKKHGTFQFMTPQDLNGRRNQLIEVAYNGFGFTLVKREVFEQIQYPWFSPEHTQIDGNIWDFSSEDVGFYMKLKRFGIKGYIDPKVIVGHDKIQTLR